MLGAILKQVVSSLEHIPREIVAAFQRSKKLLDGRELESAEIRSLLISTLCTLRRSYICIDALDEFPMEYRPELFQSLARVTRESPGTRLFVTGRPHIRGGGREISHLDGRNPNQAHRRRYNEIYQHEIEQRSTT